MATMKVESKLDFMSIVSTFFLGKTAENSMKIQPLHKCYKSKV